MVGGVLAVAALVIAGLVRRPGQGWALVGGTVLQVAVIATGIVVPAMYALGAIFGALWLTAIWLGRRYQVPDAAGAGGLPVYGASLAALRRSLGGLDRWKAPVSRPVMRGKPMLAFPVLAALARQKPQGDTFPNAPWSCKARRRARPDRRSSPGSRARGCVSGHGPADVGKDLAETHYAEHVAKPFYGSLVEFITSGPLVALVAEGPRAIEAFRALAGATDPVKAAPGTIRGDFALEVQDEHCARLGLA